ncbi:MAG: translesion DNA synthesis-associated protein ImuA [Gammaproteobacteria bacterium]|nr:translesion DNA synthesis-associated protein ImuA [Gammaproteobacteria bacterium]
MECHSSTNSNLKSDKPSDRKSRLRQLLGNPHIWRPGSTPVRQGELLPTGFSALDGLLGGGWPPGVLTELLLEGQGIGELRLLMPAIKALQLSGARGQRRSQSCWIAPPFIPYAPALARHGLDLTQLLIVSPAAARDALWAMEQALRAHTCALVLCWADKVSQQATRRLQVAAEASGAHGFLLRPVRFARQSSTAALRIRLSVTHKSTQQNRQPGDEPGSTQHLQLELLRNRYGRPGRVSLSC